MKLSETAQKYLRSQKRLAPYYADDASTIQYFSDNGLDIYPRLLEIQIKYAGYQLSRYEDPRQSFIIYIFLQKDILHRGSIVPDTTDPYLLFYFGQHDSAPDPFSINTDGAICMVYDEKNPRIIYSSVEKLIEDYAIHDIIARSGITEHGCYTYDVLDEANTIQYLSERFQTKDVSDQLGTWMYDEDSVINIAPWWSGSGDFIRIYGNLTEKTDRVLNELAGLGYIKK
ncbi:MAG: hypothetical protein JWO03_293 [Bacteroidetes bacterium]|nr:hypothetical protein [Bacteroidota bacterium]